MTPDIAQIRARAQRWLGPEFDPASQREIASLLEAQDEASAKELTDRFWRDLEFGTGGMRGVRGAGDNRMNVYTIRKAAQALASHILEAGDPAKGVVIGYDTRIGSVEFSREAARVLVACGVRVHRFESFCPVPVLSFAVRRLGCQSGIVITASHNPPEYNGFKCYWEDGAQVLPPHDTGIIARYNAMDGYAAIRTVPESALDDHPLYTPVGDGMFNDYYEHALSRQVHPKITREQGRRLRIVCTPLHGAGFIPLKTLLARGGFSDVHFVASQTVPDGRFPTVEAPNPEFPAALKLALDLARQVDADLVLATDPDADRLGVCYKDAGGSYVRPDGNQIGALLLDHLCTGLKSVGRLPSNGAMINTIVSTDLHLRIAEAHGLKTFQVLTGFKYIGEKLREWEKAGWTHRLVLGTEESYGYLTGEGSRDKDGVMAALLFSEMALAAKLNGETLDRRLEALWRAHGCHREDAHAITMKGADGAEQIAALMDRFRKSPPATLAGQRLTEIRDYERRVHFDAQGREQGKLDLPVSNVLKWTFEDGSTVTVRPSGTEPKIKFYFGVVVRNGNDPAAMLAAAETQLAAYRRDMVALAG